MMWRSRNCRCALRSIAPALVGNDGQTHAGSFDVTYLGCLPGFIIMAAGDEADLFHMVATCAGDRRRSVRGALSAG